MDIIDRIDLYVNEDGEATTGGAGTTTSDVAKVPIGTKKMYKRKKKREDEEE